MTLRTFLLYCCYKTKFLLQALLKLGNSPNLILTDATHWPKGINIKQSFLPQEHSPSHQWGRCHIFCFVHVVLLSRNTIRVIPRLSHGHDTK